MAIAHAQEAQQLGAQGRIAAAALPDRSQPARLSRACRSGLTLSVFRRKFATCSASGQQLFSSMAKLAPGEKAAQVDGTFYSAQSGAAY
jgi:hypothetical protein